MKTKKIFILFLIFTFLSNNIAYPLNPSSNLAGLTVESRYRYIAEKIERAEMDGSLDFQRLRKEIPGYDVEKLKEMLALLIYESIYFGKTSIPEELEISLWEFCRNLELDLEETKQIEFSEEEVKVYRSEKNRMTVHLICALLDEYFTGLDYSVSHIPRVLGWKGNRYYYQLAEGSEGFETYIEYDQEGNIVDPYALRTPYEKRALYLFDSFFGFSNDFADPDDARGPGKNVISDTRNLGDADSMVNPTLPRTWKIIDFVSKAGKYRTELPRFLSEYGEDIRQALGDEKYELLMIAVKQLLLLKPSFRRYRFQRLFKQYQIEKIAEIFEEQRIDKIKILVNGLGVVGKRLVSALKAIGFDVYVRDPVRERAIECVREYNCRLIDEISSVEFSIIIDASPAGQGVKNWDEIYSRLPYAPKIIFQGGEDRAIPQGIRIESCNVSAMGVLFGPILEKFNGLEIEDYYDRSGDEAIEGQEGYEPYRHGTQFKEAYPEYKGRIIRFNSFRKNGHIDGYHLHKAIVKGEGLTSKEVKELIRDYRVLVIDEILTNGIPFEDIIGDLARFRKTQEIPLLIVRVSDMDGGVTIEYAVPHRVNVVPDNVVSAFDILDIGDSISLKRYMAGIDKNKKRIEDFLYRSYIYLRPLRRIFDEYYDMWRIAHLDNSGELDIGYLDASLLGRRIEKELGWEFPEDTEECRRWIERIIKRLFRQEIPITPDLFEAMERDILSLYPEEIAWVREHAKRVAKIAEIIAERMSLGTELIRLIRIAALAHDLGKGSSKEMIEATNSSGPKMEILDKHREESINMLRKAGIIIDPVVEEAIRYHHDPWLTQTGIPRLVTEIIYLADQIDASQDSHRPYPTTMIDIKQLLGEFRRHYKIGKRVSKPVYKAFHKLLTEGQTDFMDVIYSARGDSLDSLDILDNSNSILWQILNTGSPDERRKARETMLGRIRSLRGLEEDIKGRLVRLRDEERIHVSDDLIDQIGIFLYGSYLWHAEGDTPVDKDVIVIVPDLEIPDSDILYISIGQEPGIDYMITGEEKIARYEELKETTVLQSMSTGLFIKGKMYPISYFDLTRKDILDMAEVFYRRVLGELAYYFSSTPSGEDRIKQMRKVWLRAFDSLLYLYLFVNSHGDSGLKADFNDLVTRHLGFPLDVFYRRFFLGQLERLPWLDPEIETNIKVFIADLETFMERCKEERLEDVNTIEPQDYRWPTESRRFVEKLPILPEAIHQLEKSA